jgi:hypothetical protein
MAGISFEHHSEEQLTQQQIETTLNFRHVETEPETISGELGLKLEAVNQVLAENPKQIKKLVKAIKRKSKKFRCKLSQKLMVFPVMTANGDCFEQSVLEASSKNSSRGRQALPQPALRTKTEEFSKESLKRLEVHLRQADPLEGVLDLAADCLSVLSLETATELLRSVECMQKLTQKLKEVVPEDFLLSLLSRLTEELSMQDKALALARALLDTENTGVFEEAFDSLKRMLSQATLSSEAIELAEAVSVKLSCSQLSQMNSALAAQTRISEVKARLDCLRLREAYLRLEEGDSLIAGEIVKVLHPSLSDQVLEFYEKAGWPEAKVGFLANGFSSSLARVSQESPLVADALRTLHQLLHAELKTLEDRGHKSEQHTQTTLTSLQAEVSALKRELPQTKLKPQVMQISPYDQPFPPPTQEQTGDDVQPTHIYSYEEDTDKLHCTELSTGEASIISSGSYIFKAGCCWTELPEHELVFTGGNWSKEVVSFDTETYECFQQAPMSIARGFHSAVYYADYLYVLGGLGPLKECERLAIYESQWEALPPLPRASSWISSIVVDGSLYALGGVGGLKYIDLIQRLRLDELTWQIVPLQLPSAGYGIPCFKVNSQVFFVMEKTLYAFLPQTLKLQKVKTLPQDIENWLGPSYYSPGTLYCSNGQGPAPRLKLTD